MPIYHRMAKELNDLLFTKTINGAEVKRKIGNLGAEYRKQKKDMGKTGAEPSSWRFFDKLDKLLGKQRDSYY